MTEDAVIDMDNPTHWPYALGGGGAEGSGAVPALSETWPSAVSGEGSGRAERRPLRRAPGAGLTRRAFWTGLSLVGVVALLTPYNDLVVRNSPLIGYHLPIGAMTLLALMILAVNPLLQLVKLRPFGTGELIVVFTMLLVASAAPSSGLLRYLEPMIVSPAWIGRDYPWLQPIAKLMPGWLTPARDAGSPIVSNYWLGVDPVSGGHIPVAAFIIPAVLWGVLVAALLGAAMFLAAIFRKQWVYHERLTYPLATIPLELMAAPEPGRWYNRLWRNPILWVGIAVPAGVYLLGGLHAQFPAVPTIDLQYNVGDAFVDRPWNALPGYITSSRLFLSVVGITFFIPSEIALSLWLFLVLNGLARVLFSGSSIDLDQHEQTRAMGVYVGYFGGLLWLARGHLRRVAVAAWRGSPREENEPLTYRAMVVGLVASGGVAWVWMMAVGMKAGLALLLLGVGLMLWTLMARIVAETGLFWVGPTWWPTNFFTSLLGPRVVDMVSYYWVQVISRIFFADLRETLMPYAADALRMGQEIGEQERPRWFRRLGWAIFVSVVLAAVMQHWVSYTYGRTALADQYAAFNIPQDALRETYGFTHIRPETTPRAEWTSFSFGALLVAGLMAGRALFVSWPLHPLGLVLMNAGPMQAFWFSIFIGWCVKTLLLKYGGAGAYRRARAFFIGLILGEILSAGMWMVVGLMSQGAVRYSFLPG
ncbi:MAG TPA: DUF6785 family protein [Phycisphaerae bacterium]|nr:DUF6785 family protein [Phycisphaerae bacterium]